MAALFQKKQENYWMFGLSAALIEAVYCFFIAVLMNFLNTIIIGPGDIITFLLLLIIMVFSAALSGFLIFGYPIYLVFKKQYQEAIYTILISIVTLVIVALIVILLILII